MIDCLKEYCKKERLEKENAYYYEKEKKLISADRDFVFWSLPDILIIHLKRFSNSSREEGNITPISSPLRTVFTASNRDEAIQHLSEAVASDLASRMFSELSFSGTGTPLNISYSFLSSLSEHNNSRQGPQQNPPNSNEDVE